MRKIIPNITITTCVSPEVISLVQATIMKKFIEELNQFYPEYLAAHSDRGNRILHFTGSTLFFTLVILAIFTQIYWLIALAVLIGYALPGIGHRFFQHNDSFRSSKPVLCVLCAFRMYLENFGIRFSKKSGMVSS